MMSDHEELIAKANQRIPNLPRESLSNQEKLILDMRNALEAVTVPTEKPPVHNHGTEEGRGLACPESVVGGFLQGACVLAAEQTHPFSQSPHMAAKYWGELVRARNRIAELDAGAVPVEPEWEYRRFLPSDSRLQSYQEYSSMPPLAEGWVVERRTVGEWQQVAPDEVTEGGTQ